VGQRRALPQHSFKTLCPSLADLIVPEIEVSQQSALPQHSCKALCPVWSDFIATKMEVSKHSALRQHSCKPPCPVGSNRSVPEIEVSQPAPVIGRKGSQSCSKAVRGEQRWLRRRSLTRGARPLLLLRSKLLAFL
jgi:hypothetical protein